MFSNSTTGSGIFVSKHNGSNGSQIWFKSLDGSGQTDEGLQIGLDSSGNVYVSGYSDSTDDWGGEPAQHSSSYKPWIAKLNNSNGNQIWLRKMSISRSGSLQAVMDNGTIYLAGGNSDDSIFFADGEYKNHLIMMDGTSTLSQSSFDGRDNVSFVLNSQPTSTVTVNLTSADTGEFTLSTSTLSFSTSNWNTPQQVLVYAVQDNDTSDGNQNVNLNYSSTSSDSNYNSLSGSLSVTVVNAAAPVPSEPYLLTATGGSGQVVLTWEPPLTGASSYTVYYSTDNSSFTAISPNVTNENYTHTGLAAGTAYYYYVKANNVTGSSGESNRANATTAAARTVTHTGGSSVAEGNSGTTIRTITATLSTSSTQATTVTLAATGTATGSGTDYTLSSTNITISAGATTGTATVSVV